MGIILELQQDATSSDIDILSLLRKAYLVARKLKLADFAEWIDHEMNGYGDNDAVPQYRYHKGPLVISNPLNGEIPALNSGLKKPLSIASKEPVSSLLALAENCKEGYIYSTFSDYMSAELSRKYRLPIAMRFSIKIPINQLYATIDAVRNSVLEWAITLEEEGITGDGLKFTEAEIRKANNSHTININNIVGTFEKSQIQQSTDNSDQKMD